MTWLLGSVLAVLLSEGLLRLARHPRSRAWVGAVATGIVDFSRARGDDERQRCLLHSGVASLRLGVAALGCLCGVAVLAGLPLLVLAWSDGERQNYLMVLSAVATAWSLLRIWLQRRASDRRPC